MTRHVVLAHNLLLVSLVTLVYSCASPIRTATEAAPHQPLSITSPTNRTGFTPGKSTKQDVIARLGKPRGDPQSDFWSFGTPNVANVVEVRFSQGVIEEMRLWASPDTTAQTIVDQYGPAELVVFYPQPELPSSKVPVTLAPPGLASGDLVYPSKGAVFHFSCNEVGLRTCPGVSRKAPIYYEKYFVPVTIIDWAEKPLGPLNSFYIRTWSGFTD